MNGKGLIVTVVAGALLLGGTGIAQAQQVKKDAAKKVETPKKADPAPQKGPVTEAELADWLVQVLGLARFLPANPSPEQCYAILLANGISPKEGWKGATAVSRGTLARVVVQAMGRQSEVKDPAKDESWVAFLEGQNIKFGTMGEAVDNLDPLRQPLGNEAAVVSTDPLKKVSEARPLDETLYGVDFPSLRRLLAQVEPTAPGGIPPPPKPSQMTPH